MSGIQVETRSRGIKFVTAVYRNLFKFIAFVIKGGISIAVNNQGSLCAMKRGSCGSTIYILSVTASSLPGNCLSVCKIIGSYLGIGRFPVVIVGIPPPVRAYLLRVVNFKAPPAQVNKMGAIIENFPSPPMPEPMPVIVDKIVFEFPARRRSLPKVKIQSGRHFCRLPVPD